MTSDDYNSAETFLILKHGSIANAYEHWRSLSIAEQCEYPPMYYEIIMEYEYKMQTAYWSADYQNG